MSENVVATDRQRAKRIRDLERVADAQRDHLQLQIASLAASAHPLIVTRNFIGRVVDGASFASRFLGRNRTGLGLMSLLAGLGAGTAAVEAEKHRHFPWKPALLAGLSLLQVGRWFKRKPSHE